MNISSALRQKFASVKLLALDCDGVLTDGGVYMFEDGQQFRRFCIKDGLGVQNVMKAGITVIVISHGANKAIKFRGANLGVHEVHVKVPDKLVLMSQLCQKYDITLDNVAFMGDDLVDLPLLQSVGLACAPIDAMDELKEAADYVSPIPGGYGAVRDVCNILLTVKSELEK